MNLFVSVLVALLLLRVVAMGMTDPKWYLAPDYMEDPQHREIIARVQQRAEMMDEQAITELVGRLLNKELVGDDFWTLVVLEERAVPALVAALGDSRVLEVEETYSDFYTAAKLARVWERLEPFAPVSAVPALAKLVENPQTQVRREAALGLGSIGKAACVKPLRAALRDPEHFVRSRALIGIERALAGHRAEPEFTSGIFDAVAGVVEMKSVGGTRAANVLVRIDRDRAIQYLADPQRFRATHPEIASIVRGLAAAQAVLPAQRVIELLDELERQPRLNTTAFGESLKLLALSGDSSAEARIETAMAFDPPEDRVYRSGEYLRRMAAEAFLFLNGVPDAYDVAFNSWSKVKDVSSLPEPLRNYATVQAMWNEVENGSFDQYFFNTTGDDVRHVVAGLEAVGAKKSAEITRKAMALFGPGGPAIDRVRRQQQLDQVDDGVLAVLSDELLDDPDHLQVLLARYVVRNRQHFVRAPGS